MKVRIIAGPNGSGKSTLISVMRKEKNLNMGFIINADDIEKQLNKVRKYVFDKTLVFDSKHLIEFINSSGINKKYNLKKLSPFLKVEKNNIVLVTNIQINSYLCAAIADFLRYECLKQKINFSFESVFSDLRKVLFIKKLKEAGCDIYFYFVCTINPSINIARIKTRFENDGHNVSDEKVKSRFQKSIQNAIKIKSYTKRFFVIDNSEENNPQLILETENNNKVNFINKTFFPTWAEPFNIK